MSNRPAFPTPTDWDGPPTAFVVPERRSLDQIGEQPASKQWRIDGRETQDDPLLTCLYELTRILGKPMSREGLVAGLPLDENRLTPKLLVRAANRAGFVARVSKHTIDRRMAPLCPVIALLSDERAVVITEIDRSTSIAKVIYPQAPGELVEFPLADLQAQSIGYIISIKSRYELDDRAPVTRKLSNLHWFWGALFKPWRTYRDVLGPQSLADQSVRVGRAAVHHERL